MGACGGLNSLKSQACKPHHKQSGHCAYKSLNSYSVLSPTLYMRFSAHAHINLSRAVCFILRVLARQWNSSSLHLFSSAQFSAFNQACTSQKVDI